MGVLIGDGIGGCVFGVYDCGVNGFETFDFFDLIKRPDVPLSGSLLPFPSSSGIGLLLSLILVLY